MAKSKREPRPVPTIYEKPAEVIARLHRLGLEQEDLRWGAEFGAQEANYCTDNDPRVLRNLVRWGKTFRGLADRLVSKGWSHEEERCFPTMVSPDGTNSITVSSGDGNTGRRGGEEPRSRNPKGPVTKNAVDVNQLSFADLAPSFPRLVTADKESDGPTRTWFLLYHIDLGAEEIRLELSQPARLDASEHVDHWHERILLPPVPLERAAIPQDDAEEDDIDITIERRSR